MHISCEQRSFVKFVRVFVFVCSAVEPVIRSVAALHCVLTGEVVFIIIIIIIISYGGLLNVYT